MYYNNNDKILIDSLPKVWIKNDGSLIVDFHLLDINTLADNNFYIVRNDNIDLFNRGNELEHKRQIIIDSPYVDIIRQYLDSNFDINSMNSPNFIENPTVDQE